MGTMFTPQSPQGPNLIIFSGISGSGKTTAALELMETLRAKGRQVLRINRDDLRTMLFGETYHTVPPIQEFEQSVNGLQMKLLYYAMERGMTVISDDTNLSSGAVQGLKRVADKYDAEIIEIPVIVELEVALERNRLRAAAGGRFVPEDAIRSMFERQANSLRSKGKK